MALQENISEINTLPSLKKILLQYIIDSLRNVFIISKTVPFIGGLVASYKFVELAVEFTLMDYFTDSKGDNYQQMAAVITNLQDGLSSILFVFVSLISEAYMDCFNVIALCTAAYIQGLMLLWTSTSRSAFGAAYAALFLLVLGKSGEKLSKKFLEYQLQEKIKEKNQRELETIHANIWLNAPSIVGYGITIYVAFKVDDGKYNTIFRVAALLMGGTYLLFIFGCACYRREKMTGESNLRKIYRICKVGFGKRKSKYPTSPNGYYWKDYKQEHWYKKDGDDAVRLYPRVPHLFRWLDKAAIVKEEEEKEPRDAETQKRKWKLCTVKEVREVKSLVPMIYLCFTFVAYSLLMATGSTFFVSQASNMTPGITKDGNDILILFFVMDGTNKMSRLICFIVSFSFQCFEKFKGVDGRWTRKTTTILRIGFGMFCGVICSLIAWRVEARRLSIINDNNNEHDLKQDVKNTTVALLPQFSLLGITEELVEGGLASLFEVHVVKSMWSFEESFCEMVIGTGKLLIIPFVFSKWVNETANSSRLDSFYLMLGILNAVLLLVFAYYSFKYAYKEECPVDEKITGEQTLEDSYYPENDNATQPVHPEMTRFGEVPNEDNDIVDIMGCLIDKAHEYTVSA